MKLSDLHTGERGVIVKVSGHGGFRKRIVEMGFIKGKTVTVILNAPLHDPIEYEIMGYKISLRREEAKLVEVISEKEAETDARLRTTERLSGLKADQEDMADCCIDRRMEQLAADKRRVINVALVGNPNCGKTSLFNIASGGHEHVGNYSGVTVDAKEGSFLFRPQGIHPAEATASPSCSGCSSNCGSCCSRSMNYHAKEYTIRLVDLPGTYSLSAYSPEELYVRRHLIEEMPDVVINVVDSSNIERNMYLTTQLIDMNIRIVVALNMYDELEQHGDVLDYDSLGKMLGVPMIPTVSRTGRGLRELFEMVVAVYENSSDTRLSRHIHVNHGAELEYSIDRIKHIFQKNQSLRSKYSTRYLAIKFLEADTNAQKLVESLPEHDELVAVRYEETQRLKEILKDTPDNAITDAKYGFIQGALRETLHHQVKSPGRSLTEKIDRIVTNRYLGFPLFFVLLFFIFYMTFAVGSYPMEWIEWMVGIISDFVQYSMPDGILKDLVVDGAISGVGAVIVFLPNILILYFFISILEDSGYMARAAFIMDKLMHKMGLHGKSFIPMVMGFGCNVPAIMAVRTIESRKSRLVTMLVIPLMSCSARIPVFMVLIGAFFPQYGAWMMMGLYALGILLAVILARVFSRFLIHDDQLPFVMELPPYRIPTYKAIFRHTWEKGRQYLRKMGGVILIFSVVIWALNYFPIDHQSVSERNSNGSQPSLQVQAVETPKPKITYTIATAKGNEYQIDEEDIKQYGMEPYAKANPGAIIRMRDDNKKEYGIPLQYYNDALQDGLHPFRIAHLAPDSAKNPAQQRQNTEPVAQAQSEHRSYLCQIGQIISPVFAPMGFDWKMSVGILSGIGAKELVVSTLAVMYSGQELDDEGEGAEQYLDKVLCSNISHASAFAYLIFVLLYFPCFATIIAIKNESGGWKWAIFAAVYTSVLAYVVSLIAYMLYP